MLSNTDIKKNRSLFMNLSTPFQFMVLGRIINSFPIYGAKKNHSYPKIFVADIVNASFFAFEHNRLNLICISLFCSIWEHVL